MPAVQTIKARRVRFDWEETPLHWVPGDAFTTHVINVLHLLLPAGEKWFCDVFRQALPLVTADGLRDQVKGFIGQEAVHSRAHALVLDHLAAQGLDTAGYTARIDWMFDRLLGDHGLGMDPGPAAALGASPAATRGAGPALGAGAGPAGGSGAGPAATRGAGPAGGSGAGPAATRGAGPAGGASAGPAGGSGAGPAAARGAGPAGGPGTGPGGEPRTGPGAGPGTGPGAGRGPRWLRRHWLLARLAMVAAIEHLTCVLGYWAISGAGALDEAGADPTMLDLLRWHGAEEVEHRAVAFDLYQELSGSTLRYLRRVVVMAGVLPVILGLWILGTHYLVDHDPETGRGDRASVRRYIKVSRRTGRLPTPGYLMSAVPRYLRPGHHPSREASTEEALAYLARSPAARNHTGP